MKIQKRFVVSLLSVVLSVVMINAAKPQTVQNFEGELFVGMTTAIDNHAGMTSRLGLDFGIELRKNFNGTPFDAGIQLGMTHVEHRYTTESGTFDYQGDNTLYLAAMGDYNFRQGRRVNPFAGLGVGVGFMDYAGGSKLMISGTNAVVIPRVGVELAHHIRLTASFVVIRKGFNSFDLSLGFVIGGRPKKEAKEVM